MRVIVASFDLGYGEPEDYAGVDVGGRVVLLNGLATPEAVYRAERAGSPLSRMESPSE